MLPQQITYEDGLERLSWIDAVAALRAGCDFR